LFTKQLAIEEDIVLSRKKIAEILIANGLYKPQIRRRRPKFYQSLRQNIPNGLVSIDGSEFTVWIDHVPYKFNLELSVDVDSFCHTAFSVSDSETTEEFIKVMEAHKASWGLPIGLVSDHGSANLSGQAVDYLKRNLKRNNIEMLPAGPANPKGNGTIEGAFSEMKGVIESLDFNLSSPKDLARAILEKIVSIYVAMRNRLSRFGDKIAPQEAMKIPIPEEKRQALKMKYKGRKAKSEDPDHETKLTRLDWIIRNHGLKVDEQSLKRAQKCIVTYMLLHSTGINSKWHSKNCEKQPFYLPFGKAEYTPSPSLPRVRGKVLQLHPWRLRSGESSDFCNVRVKTDSLLIENCKNGFGMDRI